MRGWPGRFVGLLVLLALGACGGTNAPPEQDRAISAGKPFLHKVDALVESDAPVKYTATLEDGRALPEWLSFDPESRTFRGVAPADLPDGSALKVSIMATGGGRTLAKTSFDLVVMAAATDVPVILNPAEELLEFDPRGLLRWSAVPGADAYEVWAYRDEALTQVQEFSGALESRQYQFTQLEGGQTYYVKIYFRAAGVWQEMPTFTLQTTSNVVKARLTNSQEELEALGPSATLRWTAVEGADVYELWIYRDAQLVAFAETSGAVRITQYQITSLGPGTTYYAQVYARVNGQFTAGGALTITVTGQLDKARIVNPQEELDNFAADGILRWSPVTGATAYELWVFTNPNVSEIYESSGSLTSRSYATRTLQPGTVYYAQAYALVNGQWQVGAPVKITTATEVTQSRLTNPQEELEAFSTAGTLRWTAVPNATAYELWIYGNAGLGTIIESGANADRSYQPTKLCSGATYYVQVYALVNGVWTTGWATRLDVTQGTSAADCKPPAPTVRLAANPTDVASGESVVLTWSTKFATGCTASGAWSGARASSGKEAVGPITKKSLFVLSCSGSGGTYRAETLVAVSNSPPVAQPAAYQLMAGDELHVALSASDPEGDPLAFRVVSPPRLGALVPLTGAPNGTYSYSPFEGVSGPDSFTFAVSDGRFESVPARVELSIVRSHAESEPWMQFVYVPAGTYRMGNSFQWVTSDDHPVHTVTLTKGFYLGKLEVTQGQWTAVMGSNPSLFKYGSDYPVDSVSWDDSQAFLRELSNRTGFRYRLPTEAEWEYAARDGGLVTQWSGTSSEAELDRYAWFNANTGQIQTRPTGTKLPNALGLHDMSGNVMEWVQDSYAPYPADAVVDPLAAGGDLRVTRGGSYRYDPLIIRTVSPRFTDAPSGRRRDYGLRVALTDEPVQQEIEPKNSQMSGAGRIVPGVPVVAKLYSLNDVDWYYVESNYSDWINVEFEIGTPPGASSWQVTWYGPDGSTVYSKRNINATFSYSLPGFSGNVYWVKVNKHDADFLFSSRPYRLTVTLTQ